MDKLPDTLCRQAASWNPPLSSAHPIEQSASSDTRLKGPNSKEANGAASDFDQARQQAGQVLQEHTRRGRIMATQVQERVHKAATGLQHALRSAARQANEQQHKLRRQLKGNSSSSSSGGGQEKRRLGFIMPWARKKRKGPHFGRNLPGGKAQQAAELVRQGKALERELNPRAALKCFEEANELMPGRYDYLSFVAKAVSDASYLDEIKGTPHYKKITSADRKSLNERAIELSKQAIQAAPDKGLPHVAACISMGRLAIFSDNKTKVRLAKEAREQAEIAVQKEPSDDLTHHLMGRWHWEMAQLNAVVRALIRMMWGTALAPGSYTEALACYQRAAAIDSTRLVHRVELGRVHAKLGNRDEAIRQLDLALTLDVEDINAWLQRADIPPIMKQLKRRRWQLPTAPAPEPAPAASAPAPQEADEAAAWKPRPAHAQAFPSMCEHANPYDACMRQGGEGYDLDKGLRAEVPEWLQHSHTVLGNWRSWPQLLQKAEGSRLTVQEEEGASSS